MCPGAGRPGLATAIPSRGPELSGEVPRSSLHLLGSSSQWHPRWAQPCRVHTYLRCSETWAFVTLHGVISVTSVCREPRAWSSASRGQFGCPPPMAPVSPAECRGDPSPGWLGDPGFAKWAMNWNGRHCQRLCLMGRTATAAGAECLLGTAPAAGLPTGGQGSCLSQDKSQSPAAARQARAPPCPAVPQAGPSLPVLPPAPTALSLQVASSPPPGTHRAPGPVT